MQFPYEQIRVQLEAFYDLTVSTFFQVISDFRSDFGGFSLIDYYGGNDFRTGFEVGQGGRMLTHSGMDALPESTYYWNLPEKFLGDKVIWMEIRQPHINNHNIYFSFPM